MTAPDPGRPFGVLVVCTANICRSPAAEVMLRRALGPAGDVWVASAGLAARVGSPVDDEVRRLLGEQARGPGARQLTGALVDDADLVLTMTREQRADLVSRHPAAVRRTFTLREFADLAWLVGGEAADLPPGSGARLAAVRASAPRLRARRAGGPDDDVADPYGRGTRAHEVAFAEIGAAVRAIATVLAAPEVVR